MLLLHVSDIHFHHPICNTNMDPDLPYRTALVRDARDRIKKLGPVGAILVSGDIAYTGSAEEYEAAYKWLKELAHACGCPLERVYVIPGNHDVDRRIAKENLSARNVHRSIRAASPTSRESELFAQFLHLETGSALFAPISAYNSFAAKFNCQVYAPDRLFWSQDLFFDDFTTLRFYGLTSTLLSGSDGQDDQPQNLYLSPLQTTLNPVDGIVNIVVCHHPPDWCMDSDEIEDAVRGRASLHFFGHKHRQRLHRDQSYVRFSAGAVNPDRNQRGWEPGYNIVRLEAVQIGETRHLEIEAHLLVWQTNPDMFRAKKDVGGEDVFRHRIAITSASAAASSAPMRQVVESEIAPMKTLEVAVEATMSDERTRNLVLRFWNLASSERREIALDLQIVSDEEIRKYPEPERYGRALRRAGERGLIERLADEIEKREGR
jgi:3',5'-cyclic AMP phosphodiesterase CpdA